MKQYVVFLKNSIIMYKKNHQTTSFKTEIIRVMFMKVILTQFVNTFHLSHFLGEINTVICKVILVTNMKQYVGFFYAVCLEQQRQHDSTVMVYTANICNQHKGSSDQINWILLLFYCKVVIDWNICTKSQDMINLFNITSKTALASPSRTLSFLPCRKETP